MLQILSYISWKSNPLWINKMLLKWLFICRNNMFEFTEIQLWFWAWFPRNISELFEGCVLDISRFPLQITCPSMATPLISFPSNPAWLLIIKRFISYEGWNFNSGKGLSPCDFDLIPKMKEPLLWHSLQNCSRDSSGGRPLHSNYQHNRRC